MPVSFEPSKPADVDEIASLLTTAFNAPADAAFVERRLLQWKYFEPYGDGSTPRSYVLRQGDAIVAHCVAAPLTLRLAPRGEATPAHASAICFTDWAGGRKLPGAGVMLMKKLMAQAPIAIVAGGSDATRQAIPRLGFAIRDTIDIYARVVRPLRQARTRPSSGIAKDIARFARNMAWSRAPLGAIAPGWDARPVAHFDSVATSDEALARAEHSTDYLNYWLRCPASQVSGFEIRYNDAPAGYFLLSRVGGQTRIAAISVTDPGSRIPDPGLWQQAVRLATRAAAYDPETAEVVCMASTPAMRRALEACGFQRRDHAPLFLFDPKGLVESASPVFWSGIDDDTAYVPDPASPYRT